MKNQRVLITGGAGYLGSVITRHLLQKGNKVTCLDNLIYNQTSPLSFVDNPNFNFVFGDVRDKKLVSKLVEKNDIIFPLAAIVGMPACNKRPEDARTINFEAVKMLNDLRDEHQVVVYPTTNSGYGTKTGEMHCTEETPLEPISLYGVTKSDAEKMLLESGKPVITLRLATVFGMSPRMRLDLLVNDFVWTAMTKGSMMLYEPHFLRNFIGIKDIARVFEHCVDNFPYMKNNVYNVGLEDANLSKAQLAEKVKSQIPSFVVTEGEGRDPDQRNYIVSNKKLMGTGFKAQTSLDEGIKELIKGYEILLKTGSPEEIIKNHRLKNV